MTQSNGIVAWSFSRWSLWDRCPAAFKYRNIDRLPEPQGDAALAGDALHREAAQYISQPPGGSIPVPLSFVAHFEELITAVRGLPRKMAEFEITFRRNWTVTGWRSKDAWLRNKLDVFALNADDTAEVIDWKSGAAHEEHKEQLQTYALAAFLFKRTINFVRTRMTYVNSGEEMIYDFTRDDLPALQAKWEARGNALIEATDFPARPNHLCGWCHFRASNGGPCKFS